MTDTLHVPGLHVPFAPSPPLAPLIEQPRVLAENLEDWLEIKMALRARIDEAERNAALMRKVGLTGADHWEAVAKRCRELHASCRWGDGR